VTPSLEASRAAVTHSPRRTGVFSPARPPAFPPYPVPRERPLAESLARETRREPPLPGVPGHAAAFAAAAGLSIKRLQGQDLSFLILDYQAWPDEPWRLFTACLLHVNYLHLAFNLLWTLRFGYVLEPIFGSLAMAGIFVLLGMGSMAAEWAFLQGGIGLSGIGYGLFGLTWALDRYHPSFAGSSIPAPPSSSCCGSSSASWGR
jgi:hypothetical protein